MAGNLKAFLRAVCPPVAWKALIVMQHKMSTRDRSASRGGQDLDLYWDAEMAELLEKWGEDTAWAEIQFLMSARSGKVLDIACGTGAVMTRLSKSELLSLHGCDISDLLIGKAVEAGIPQDHLTICDATRMPYSDQEFDFSYSIGSLEHFTEDGIIKTLFEAARITRVASFHMVPTSRSDKDEGWLKTYQSMHNCSVEWWRAKFDMAFRSVHVFDSRWNDNISVGKWFMCSK